MTKAYTNNNSPDLTPLEQEVADFLSSGLKPAAIARLKGGTRIAIAAIVEKVENKLSLQEIQSRGKITNA